MLKIVFMGTPDFAVASLDAILHSGHEIAAVVTAPDKPAGRGRKMAESDIKKFCDTHDLPVLQPVNLKDAGFINIMQGLKPDLMVVVAFRMLPKSIWSIPAKGTINLHASLLPQFRGAAPINHALIKGEKETGLTTFLINENIDTGDILLQEKMTIGDDETFGMLHDRMKLVGSELLIKTLKMLDEGNFAALPQASTQGEYSPAPKLTRENTRIDWSKSSQEVNNLVRGLSPAPGAWTLLCDANGAENMLKILETSAMPSEGKNEDIGTLETDGKTFLYVNCGTGKLKVNKLQLSGRGAMLTNEFLRGYANLLQGSTLK